MLQSKSTKPEMLVLTEGTKITRLEAGQMLGDPAFYDEIVTSGYVKAVNHDVGLINFVGIGVYGEHAITFLPKIFRNVTSISDQQTKLLVRTLKKYAKTIPERHPDADLLSPVPDEG